MPYRALLPLLAAVGAGAQTYVNGTGLESNDPGHPQDATGALCSGRPRPGCEVQLDVPEACTPQAGQPSLCPGRLLPEWCRGQQPLDVAGALPAPTTGCT